MSVWWSHPLCAVSVVPGWQAGTQQTHVPHQQTAAHNALRWLAFCTASHVGVHPRVRQLTCLAPRLPTRLSCGCCAAIHDMNRKQQPKQEQYCEEDWNSVSTIEAEAYWVSKVRHRAHSNASLCVSTQTSASDSDPASVQGCGCALRLPSRMPQAERNDSRQLMQAGSTTPAQAGAARSCLPGFPALSVSVCQVEAERAAWQLAEELDLDVVTILPNFVLVGVTAWASWPGCSCC